MNKWYEQIEIVNLKEGEKNCQKCDSICSLGLGSIFFGDFCPAQNHLKCKKEIIVFTPYFKFAIYCD